MSIRWADGPSGGDAPRISIQVFHTPHRYQKHQPAFVRLLGPWRAVWLHWTRTGRLRTTACKKPPEVCVHCPESSFLYGYAPAALWQKDRGNNQEAWCPIVCGIPAQLMDSYSGQTGTGLALQLWRELVGKEWRLMWQVNEKDIKNLPMAAFDITPILEYWWGYEAKQAALQQQAKDTAWREDLNDLVEQAAPPAAPPKPTAPLPPPMPNGAPPRPPRPSRPAAAAPSAKIREIMARSNVIPFRRPVEATVEPATAAEVPEAPPAAKRARRGRKGGA
jgi:hypothetical protein